jgi:hypothetical protein
MKKSQVEATTANNLEEKFDRGEDVLDYFDVRKARVIRPQSKASAGNQGLHILQNRVRADELQSFARNPPDIATKSRRRWARQLKRRLPLLN